MNDHGVRNRIFSLAELAAAQGPQLYQLLNRIGSMNRRRRAARIAQSAGWFGAGVAVGIGLAALFTPESGPEIRRRLSSRARRMREYVAPRAPKGNGAAPVEAQERT
jgi:hypothetical protein